MNIELFPLEKAVVDGQSIPLGANRASVEEVLGTGEQVDNRTYYFGNNLCVEYDEAKRVSFIEVSCNSPKSPVTATIYGEDITKNGADSILQILTEKNHGEMENENGYSYTFFNLSVGVYRELTLDDYKELIEEMNTNGTPVEGNPDAKADFWKSTHWATIGIGTKNYYR